MNSTSIAGLAYIILTFVVIIYLSSVNISKLFPVIILAWINIIIYSIVIDNELKNEY